MEWLKKRWELIAFSGVGILVLYWLYQTYQSNQAASIDRQTLDQASQDTLYSGILYGGGSGGFTSPNPIQPPVSTVASDPTSVSTQQNQATAPPPGQGYANPVISEPGPTLAGYHFDGNALVADTPDTSTASTPSPVSVMLGSGGSNNDTAPVAIQATVLSQINDNLTHVSNGTIPQHGTAIPKTPSPVELASLGGRL